MVVFSSTTRTSNIESAYEMGADLFFIKPVAYADLVSAITALLALNWSDRQKVKEQYLINGRHTAFM
jgi:DNA-binding NarL/FixJ family response regulator